jgi:hypothetical protein
MLRINQKKKKRRPEAKVFVLEQNPNKVEREQRSKNQKNVDGNPKAER